MVLASGRRLVGTDHAGAYLANAATKFPQASIAKNDLQDLPYRGEFDGVLCVDAMEFAPPEDWPVVLGRFRRALRPGLGVPDGGACPRRPSAGGQPGGPTVGPADGGWRGPLGEPDGYYQHYPSVQRVRAWLANAGFATQEGPRGPWHQEVRLPPCAGPLGSPARLRMSVLWHLDRPRSRRWEQRGYRG
jgi:Methyltransferase domain